MHRSHKTLVMTPVALMFGPCYLIYRLSLYLLTARHRILQQEQTALRQEIGSIEENVRLAMLDGDRDEAYRFVDQKPGLDQRLSRRHRETDSLEQSRRVIERCFYPLDRLLRFQK